MHPGPALPTPGGSQTYLPLVTRRYEAPGGLAESPEIDWRGMVVLPDLSVVTVDMEFAATMLSVMEGESHGDCSARNTANVNGHNYEVRGAMQLLLDRAILGVLADMGYQPDDLYECAPNVLVAERWWKTASGRTWRLWEVKPTYRTDGWISTGGY